MHANLDDFFRWDDAVNAIQLERGTSAAWLTSGGTNQRALGRLPSLWQDTDSLLSALNLWPSEGLAVSISCDNSTVYGNIQVSENNTS
jgi:hypothetical protein